jgi:pimeloyl-ACP methyl ester carboxylesterase
MKPLRKALALTLGLIIAAPAWAQGTDVVRSDHKVLLTSTAPGMAGQAAEIYVREVKLAAGKPRGVVLFVHGAGTPAEVSFDVPYQDYSWMAYLAKAGFDAFSMDLTGYGRSSRPPPMSDPCNLPAAQQPQFVPAQIPAACPTSWKGPITTMGSDWDDISAVVDNLLKSQHVDKLAIVAWSQGGPRSFGYTIRHADKVSRLVVLAPAYNPTMPTDPPAGGFPAADPMNSQSQTEFMANWDRQAPCPGEYEPQAAASVWSELLASDAVGKTWGPGVRRAPNVPSWGFNQSTVAKMTTPYLMVSGTNDKQVPQERVRTLYADLGSKDKVFIDLACSSHNAMWEKNHLLLFKASLDWLTTGKVEGVSHGMLKMGS